MQRGDISRPNTGPPLSRRRSGLVVAALLLALYAAVILGLRIEQVWLFILYLATAAFLIFAYQRLTALPRWISAAFRDNTGLAAVILIVLLILYPIVLRDDAYLIHIAALSAIFAVMALGLNITLGFAGLLDIGFAVYFGAGAYTSAQLAIHFGISFWLGAVAGGLVAAMFGFLVAWPALRVHDHYLGLVTLGYGLMMNLLARNLNFLTNGTDGVIDIPPPVIGSHPFTEPMQILSFSLPFQANFYYLALAAVLLTVFVSYRLLDSKLGRAWEAIREDEIAAKCSGVNAQGLKILAFSTGAFFGGIGGAMYAHMIGFISPDSFAFIESITILVMVVIGGAGNILGVVVGAVALVVLPERFREFEHLRLLIFGLALVLLMINRPQGIFPRVRTRRGPQAGAHSTPLKPSARRVNLA
jgi:ABC-type branched-subunit amino acid transport system permease subunit